MSGIRAMRKVAAVAMGVFAICASTALLGSAAGYYLNTTVSIPRGLYRSVDAPFAPGRLVVVCPPIEGAFVVARERQYIPHGSCPGGYAPLMKRALAAKGDHVRVTPRGVFINGRLARNSAQLQADAAGRPMPALLFARELAADEIFLMGDESAVSFDGRYFGPMSTHRIRAVVTPVLTW